MKNILYKVGLIFMAISSIISISSCAKRIVEQNTSNIKFLLQEKYGCEFEIVSLGDRFSTDKANTVTAVCYPTGNRDLIFEAEMNTDNELVRDDYKESVVEAYIAEIIITEMENRGIPAAVKVHVAKISSLDKVIKKEELDEFIAANDGISVTFHTAVSNVDAAQDAYAAITNALMSVYSKNTTMSIGTTVWNLEEASYKECCEKMSVNTTVSKTFFEDYKPIGSSNIAVVDGRINKTADMFCTALSNSN